MKGKILSERNLVVVLFVMVLITFAFAQEDSKKMEKAYIGLSASTASSFVSLQQPLIKTPQVDTKEQPAADLPE
jgi:hypothetical protein